MNCKHFCRRVSVYHHINERRVSAAPPSGLRNVFDFIFLEREKIIYSSNVQDVNTDDLTTVWSSCNDSPIYSDPEKVRTAIANSFTCQFAFVTGGRREAPQLVGFARTISGMCTCKHHGAGGGGIITQKIIESCQFKT